MILTAVIVSYGAIHQLGLVHLQVMLVFLSIVNVEWHTATCNDLKRKKQASRTKPRRRLFIIDQIEEAFLKEFTAVPPTNPFVNDTCQPLASNLRHRCTEVETSERFRGRQYFCFHQFKDSPCQSINTEY